MRMDGKIICPECGSDDVVKAGTSLTREGRKQRWQCKVCARKFIPEREAKRSIARFARKGKPTTIEKKDRTHTIPKIPKKAEEAKGDE